MTQLDDALLAGKILLVSGGTQGLGAAVAEAATRNGAKVAVTGRRKDVGAEFAASLTASSGQEIFFAQADAGDVRLATVVHHRNAEGGGRVGLFFAAVHEPERHGQVVNAEPHKCAQLAWFPLDAMPDPTYRYTAADLRAVQESVPLHLDGWQ